MDGSEMVKVALAVFLVVSAIGLAFLLYRMAGLFLSLSRAIDRMTDETIPILTRAHTTMDGVNQEISRVDEIMESAVHATKGTEAAVGSFARMVSAPVRIGAGLLAGLEEAADTFRSRRAAERANRRAAATAAPGGQTPPPAAEAPVESDSPGEPAPAQGSPTSGDDADTGEFPMPGTAPPAAGAWADARARREAAAMESARRSQERMQQ